MSPLEQFEPEHEEVTEELVTFDDVVDAEELKEERASVTPAKKKGARRSSQSRSSFSMRLPKAVIAGVVTAFVVFFGGAALVYSVISSYL